MWTWCLHAMRSAVTAIAIGTVSLSSASAQTGQPIRIGLSLALTGAGAAPSKVISTALEMWRDDVNAKGGLLGRPVELVIYDDQSTPANVPAIYTKLVTLDKVDLLLGPYGTNFVAPAMPAIMAHNKMTISFTAIGINDKFKYDKYFSMVSVGPDGVHAFSRGFFEIAMAQKPQPETVAMLAADAEFARTAADGARDEIKKHRLKLVYDQSYPPQTTDFSAVMRAVRAANADVVWIGAYPPDNVGILRAADETGLSPKIFAAGSGRQWLVDRGELRCGSGAKHSGRCRFPQAVWREGERGRHRSARLCLGSIRLFGRTGADAGRDGDEEPRSCQACGIHAPSQVRCRSWQLQLRERRRMGAIASSLDAIPERAAEQPRSVPRWQSAANNLARRCQNGESDLPIRRSEEEVTAEL